MRETTADKSRRYLLEHRLIVDHVVADDVHATCRGTGAIHELGHDPNRGWWCTCSPRANCSHLLALMAVTIRHRATPT